MPDLDAEFDARLDLFLDHVTAPLENATQRAVFAEYAVGLLSDVERKSMEPLAALARPDDPGAAHKAFVYFTGTARWEDLAVRRHAVAWALWGMTAGGPIRGTILDDTGILKQGTHSVGVQRQYTGSAGKITNCQIAVTLGVYTAQHSALVDVDLYLPQEWISSSARRRQARVPQDKQFRTKGEIALDMLKSARRDGVPLGDVLLADADYGRLWDLRQWCRDEGMHYAVGIHETQHIWDADGTWTEPMSVEEYVSFLGASDFRRIEWRTGSNGKRLSARFAFLKVQVTRGGAEPVSGDDADRVAGDRVARRRSGTQALLPVPSARDDEPAGDGRNAEGTLADRAHPRGPQGGGGVRPLRGPLVAWVATSRHARPGVPRAVDRRTVRGFPPQSTPRTSRWSEPSSAQPDTSPTRCRRSDCGSGVEPANDSWSAARTAEGHTESSRPRTVPVVEAPT
jgi:hypothetical protein